MCQKNKGEISAKSVCLKNLFIVFFLFFSIFISSNNTDAASFTRAYVRLDRLKASTSTTGLVCANPASVGIETDVQVVFPTGFTVSTTLGNWTVATTGIPAGSTAWPGIGTATAVSGQTVTFPSGNLTAGTLYCFTWTNTAALTTSTAGNDKIGSITTRTVTLVTVDSSNYALSIISDDQIVVTATVPATFSFTLSGNTDTFSSNLSTTTTSTSGKSVTVLTNAGSGWVVWAKSANAALNSASSGGTIATAGSIDAAPTDLASVTGYVLDTDLTTDSATGGTGTVTIDPEYNGTNTTSGGTLSTSFQPIASANGVTDGDVITLIERAKISAIQKAATDYTDTLTVVGAGLF